MNKWLLCSFFLMVILFSNGFTGDMNRQAKALIPGPQLLISPQPLYFGQIPDGKIADRDLLIYNNGNQDLTVTKIEIQGVNQVNFTLLIQSGTITIPRGDVFVLPVRFHAMGTGARYAQIKLESNAPTSPDLAELVAAGTDLSASLITFERILGTPENDGGGQVRQTSDDGYIIAGGNLPHEKDYNDAYLVKTDIYGQIEWTRNYGGDDSDGFAVALPTNDGGYVALGTTDSYGAGRQDVYLVKISGSGDEVWRKTFGGLQDDRGRSLIKSPNGGYLILADTKSSGAGGRDVYLIKVDDSGNEQWNKTIGGTGGEDVNEIQVTGDNGYIIAGSTNSSGAGQLDVYVIKIDASGTVLWSYTYGGPDWDEARSIHVTNDGGYIIAGYTASFGAGARDIYVLRLEAGGGIVWTKTFGGVRHDDGSYVIPTVDGGYLIAGTTDTADPARGVDVLLIKTDASGNLIWQRTFGGVASEGMANIITTSDGGYAMSGSTSSFSQANDIYFIKTDNQGLFIEVEENPMEYPISYRLMQNYPNPFNPRTFIQYQIPSSARVVLQIYNIRGQLVQTVVDEMQQTGDYTIPLDLNELCSGLYFYQLRAGDFLDVKRMMLLK